MEVVPGLAGLPEGLPPDVALWLLELRGGLGLPALPVAWGSGRDKHLPDGRFDEEAGPLLRSATHEDLSLSGEQAEAAAMDVLSTTASTLESDTAGLLSDLDSDNDSDRSADSLEEAADRPAPLPPPRPLPPLPPPREDDMLARLSGGECRALPAVMEEDEEDLTQDDEDEEDEEGDDESVTVLQALGWTEGWVASIDVPSYSSPSPEPPLNLRRTLSAGALCPAGPARAPRRANSAPQLLPVTPVPPLSPTPSPTLTAATPDTPDTPSPTVSTSTACAEALDSARSPCRDLDDDQDRTLSQSISVDEDMVFDDEFLALCSEANHLVETSLRPEAPPAVAPEPAPPGTHTPPSPPQRPKFDINDIFDRGLNGPVPPRPPARKRRKARVELELPLQEQQEKQEPAVERRARSSSESSAAASASAPAPADVEVRCHTAELLLMTRASERTHLKRSRSVSAADRDPDDIKSALCASSPELRSPYSPTPTAPVPEVADDDNHDGADGSPRPAPRRKGSVSSDVVAWQYDLLWAGLSDGEEADAEATLSCLETKQWFSSSDNKGRVYFFEENSCESSWNLPDAHSSAPQDSNFDDEGSQQPEEHHVLSSAPNEDSVEKPAKLGRSEKQEKISLRTTKSRSMVIVDSGIKDPKSMLSRNWPQLFDGDMCVLKEGSMYRTKITENGKKLRKNWVSSHVVLTELFLLLFRDAKSFAAMKSSAPGSTASRPELTVDLNGALIDQIDRGDKASVTSRKNVFLVSTVYGLQVLFQCDSSQQAEEWYSTVHTAIHNLPSGFDSCPRIKVTKEMDRLFGESNSPEQAKKFPRIGRSKSVKIKNKDGSIEDLTVSVAERQTKIKARLKKFFNRRPTMESLVKKGIWKDEPAFGCYLDQVCGNESPRVPLFVQQCIAVIESSDDNMKTDGLYRASGNLSQVQKIRLQVDQNNLSALDQEEDVHVLTGALKLFFRELKEPLIPYSAFNKAIKASTLQNKKDKLSQFREIVKSLPTANHDTLKFLLRHLLKVTGYQEFNRMHIPNLAIVFGPTLMWPEQESLNMALDLMKQNLVIEAFLLDFDSIFR